MPIRECIAVKKIMKAEERKKDQAEKEQSDRAYVRSHRATNDDRVKNERWRIHAAKKLRNKADLHPVNHPCEFGAFISLEICVRADARALVRSLFKIYRRRLDTPDWTGQFYGVYLFSSPSLPLSAPTTDCNASVTRYTIWYAGWKRKKK